MSQETSQVAVDRGPLGVGQIDDEWHRQRIRQERPNPTPRDPDEIRPHLCHQPGDGRAGNGEVRTHKLEWPTHTKATKQPANQAQDVHGAGQLMNPANAEIAAKLIELAVELPDECQFDLERLTQCLHCPSDASAAAGVIGQRRLAREAEHDSLVRHPRSIPRTHGLNGGVMSSKTSGVWVFDCDGVLLNSNQVKTAAFQHVAMRYGSDVAASVVEHHLANGGMSRFAKFDRLFSELLRRPPAHGEMEYLLGRFAEESRAGLATVDIDSSAHRLLSWIRASGLSPYVASGGAEDEVRWALQQHGLDTAFDGVFGSPTSKREIVRSVLAANTTGIPAVLVGDSRLDMEVAADLELHAVFVSHWTEFDDWRGYAAAHAEVLVVEDLADLFSILSGEHDDDGRALPTWLRSLS